MAATPEKVRIQTKKQRNKEKQPALVGEIRGAAHDGTSGIGVLAVPVHVALRVRRVVGLPARDGGPGHRQLVRRMIRARCNRGICIR